jgi:hypothetical protein
MDHSRADIDWCLLRCMRRLHSNLAYLAALADKKGSVQVPPSPSYLMAPPLNLTIRIRGTIPATDGKPPTDPTTDRAERYHYMKGLYTKLQALFPGVDPSIEPQLQGGGPGQNQTAQRAAGTTEGSTEASSVSGAQRTPQLAISAPPQGQTQSTPG